MRLTLERRRPPPAAALIELVTPRTNGATITPVENLLAALPMAEPFALEIAATPTSRRFLLRAPDAPTRDGLARQLGATYPQAELRRVDVAHDRDPARAAPDERVEAVALALRASACLPLRTFADPDVDAERTPQADPVLGILAALGDLPDGWRALAQLVLRPAPDDWSRGYLPLALERPTATRAGADGASALPVLLLAGLMAAAALGLQAAAWYAAGAWPELALLAGGLAAGGTALWRLRALLRRPVHDPRLVREKVGPIAYRAELRLAVFAPATVDGSVVRAHLARVAAAYRQFNLAAGNGLVPRRLRVRGDDLAGLGFLSGRAVPVLTTRELAGLWHPPQAGADAPLLERTTARRLLPVPETVARGCPIGVSEHQGRVVPVALPDELLARHLLLVAKTRRGKSALMLRIARYLMERPPDARPAVVLIDPHRDLAEDALAGVPPGRDDDVVHLDLTDRARPFGLNLLDVGLGWDRDAAVANALRIFERQFGRNWGPRMEDAFGFALRSLYAYNEARCADSTDGRDHQLTILAVPPLFVNAPFRRRVLARVDDPVVKAWWRDYFDPLERRFQQEIINPVQTKIQRLAGSRAVRRVVGQPRSTVDPREWLHRGRIVLVSTARGVVGEDAAALVGATLFNLVGLTVAAQAGLPAARRRRVALLVDEFHALPGADYEVVLAELAKYGASLVLATQSLARLDALDRAHDRALKATVFANLDGLFAFHCSAEDARYLVPELGAPVEEADLVSLGEHRCYARLSVGGERLPVCSVRLDAPPEDDPVRRADLASASAARYGRAGTAGDADPTAPAAGEVAEPTEDGGAGTPVAPKPTPAGRPARNQHRNRPERARAAGQLELAPIAGAATARPDGGPRGPAVTP